MSSDLVDYFRRIGATIDEARHLADHFGSVDAFLRASFAERLEAVVGSRQALAVADHYGDFETFRDRATFREIGTLDGVGRKSAGRISAAFLRGTIFTPRDVLPAEAVARKMGLIESAPVAPDQPQVDLTEWSA